MRTRIAALSFLVLLAAGAVGIRSSDVPPARVRDAMPAATTTGAATPGGLAADGLCTIRPRGIHALESGASCGLPAPETGS
jgi:hypothetical protein